MDSDHSSYSSMNKSSMAESDTATAEESGWTSYFEDFMAAQQKDNHQNNSFTDYHHHHHHLDDQPVLSDAVSHVVWNNNNNIDQSMSGAAPKFSKKLNLFKKTSRRTREILYDDSLEDTASSPVNSPKVGSQEMGFNQIKVDDIIENSLGKGGGFDGHLQLQKKEDQSREEMVFDQENNNGNTDLRKRGLCLVPLSMFVKYI